MKLSKALEDTLKEVAKFVREQGKSAVPGVGAQAKALTKDITQLRKALAEMPEPGTIVGDGSGMALPGIGEVETTGMTLQEGAATITNATIKKGMTVTGHLYVTGDVIFQAVPDTDLKDGDMMVKGDLFVTGDINLPAPQKGENPCAQLVAEVKEQPSVWIMQDGKAYARVSDEQIESVLEGALVDVRQRSGLMKEEPKAEGFEVAIYANPVQLDAGAMLLGVRKAEEGLFTEPLYRKQK